MGLDVCFSIEKAAQAGLVVTKKTNGTAEAVQRAKADGYDPDYIEWLEREEDVIHVPNTDLQVIAYRGSVRTPEGIEFDTWQVRANKWGRIHEPLTQWLDANNIEYWEI